MVEIRKPNEQSSICVYFTYSVVLNKNYFGAILAFEKVLMNTYSYFLFPGIRNVYVSSSTRLSAHF